MFLKLVWFGSKISIVSIKNVPKRFIIHKAVKTCAFCSPPLILRLYTGCRLDQTLSKCTASFPKVKRIEVLFIFETLRYSFCACIRNTLKIVTFAIGDFSVCF